MAGTPAIEKEYVAGTPAIEKEYMVGTTTNSMKMRRGLPQIKVRNRLGFQLAYGDAHLRNKDERNENFGVTRFITRMDQTVS